MQSHPWATKVELPHWRTIENVLGGMWITLYKNQLKYQVFSSIANANS